jgi:hypothetical protein
MILKIVILVRRVNVCPFFLSEGVRLSAKVKCLQSAKIEFKIGHVNESKNSNIGLENELHFFHLSVDFCLSNKVKCSQSAKTQFKI